MVEELTATVATLETQIAADAASAESAMTHTWLILCGAFVMSAARAYPEIRPGRQESDRSE